MKTRLDHVMDELARYDSPTKRTSAGQVMVLCPHPNHKERTPSCSVNLGASTTVRIGTWYCFGCGAKGGWNQFADFAGLKKIEGEVEALMTEGYSFHALAESIEAIKPQEVGDVLKHCDIKSYVPWPADREWRGYTGELINSLGGLLYYDRSGEPKCFLPVMVFGELQGGVRAELEKPKDRRDGNRIIKAGPSYKNSPGSWVKSRGWLYYDIARQMLESGTAICKTVVVVEGPRDPLRFIQAGIPAVAGLGTQTLTLEKLRLLDLLDVDVKWSCFDNDNAGRDARNKLRELIGKKAFKHIKLPHKNVIGKKMDADSMPRRMFDDVVEHIIKETRKRGGR